MQRKKIGLSRRSKKALQSKILDERNKMSAISYIHTHFNRKECTRFVPAIRGYNENTVIKGKDYKGGQKMQSLFVLNPSIQFTFLLSYLSLYDL